MLIVKYRLPILKILSKFYNYLYRIKLLSFFTFLFSLAFSINIIFNNENQLFLDLFYFFILRGIFIALIIITQNWIDKTNKLEYSLFNSIVKYVLIILLFFIALILIVLILKFILSFITLLKSSIINKLNDLKLSLNYRLHKLNNKPQKPEFNFYSYYKQGKKSKKKALALKEKLLQIKDNPRRINPSSLAEKRNWKGKITIENTSTYSSSDQLKKIEYEFDVYNNQEKNFKNIVVDINKGRENFYSNESKSLFNSYVDVIKILKRNLKEMEKNLKKEIK